MINLLTVEARNMNVSIREVKRTDAEKLSKLIQKIDNDSKYMLWSAGERKISPEMQLKMIESFLSKPNSTIFVADENNNLVGYLLVNGGQTKKNAHAAYVVIGIDKAHRGKGIGTQLFDHLDKWAIEKELHRLELTVVTSNKGAVSLYKKQGFEIEGTKKHSLYIEDRFYDEYYMAKIYE